MEEPLFPTPFTTPTQDPLISKEPTSQQVVDGDKTKKRSVADYGWLQFGQDVVNYDMATARAVLGESAPAPDPDWEPSQSEITLFKEQVPEWLHDRLFDAESADHLRWLIPRLIEEDAATTRLGSLGTGGQAGRIALSMLDPVELIASIGAEAATVGLATPLLAARAGLKAKTAARLLGGASNAAVGVGINAVQGEDDPLDYGLGMALDFGLGYALAPSLVGPAKKQSIDVKTGVAGSPAGEAAMVKQYDAMLQSYDNATSAGAAAAPRVDDLSLIHI